jgi:hypothetical protein
MEDKTLKIMNKKEMNNVGYSSLILNLTKRGLERLFQIFQFHHQFQHLFFGCFQFGF